MNRRAVMFAVAALVALLVGGAGTLVGLYIDWLWFDSVGYLFVFQTMLTARALLFAVRHAALLDHSAAQRPGGAALCAPCR